MSRGERKYLLILGATLLVFVLFQILGKKPYDWTITLVPEDKDPFGTYILNESIPDLFEGTFSHSYATLYEIEDSTYQNLFILAETFYPGEEDVNVLLQKAVQGSNVLISAYQFSILLEDTLGFKMEDYSISSGLYDERNQEGDSVTLQFAHSQMPREDYTYPVQNTYSQFSIQDSTAAKIIAVNDAGAPVFISFPMGKGMIYLNCTPLIFTNHFMLQQKNYRFASQVLSFLDNSDLHWTEYYQTGRRESMSPLRYVLSKEGLTWGYYLLILGILLFMIFEARRKQRIIPVIEPLRNTSLDFVRTISNLYYQHQDHKNIAEKRINYFLDMLRKTYFLQEHLQGKPLYEKLAAKSGHSMAEVEYLFSTMYRIRSKSKIAKTELIELNTLIENFRI